MKSSKFLGLTLTLFSVTAFAQDAAAPEPGKGMLLQLPMLLALFGLFYFGMIRPQKNQAKKHTEFLSKLNRGDEVVTGSGIIGTIRGLTDRVVTLEIAAGTEIKVLKSQVQSHLKDLVGGASESKTT